MSDPKAFVSNFKLQFGALQVSGVLMPVKAPDNGPKLKVCTPDGKPVQQFYIDEDGNKFTQGQLHKATVDEDGNLNYVGKEEVKQAKTSDLPKNVMNIKPVTQASLADKICPGSMTQPYVFIPDDNDPANVQWHDVLYTMVKEGGSVFIGMCNLKNQEGFFKVTIFKGHLCVEKQILSSEMNEFDPIPIDVDDSIRAKALGIVSAKTEEFNPDEFSFSTKEKLKILVSEEHSPEDYTPENIGKIDLMSALDDLGF